MTHVYAKSKASGLGGFLSNNNSTHQHLTRANTFGESVTTSPPPKKKLLVTSGTDPEDAIVDVVGGSTKVDGTVVNEDKV